MKNNHDFNKSNQTRVFTHASDLLPKDKTSIKILRDRAAFFAKQENHTTENNTNVNYIHFRLGESEHYGIPYHFTKEVIDNIVLTKLPRINASIAGVINRRGSLLTLLDLNKFLTLNITTSQSNNRIIVVESNGMTVGILADYISGSDTYDAGKLNLDSSYEGLIDSRYVIGLHNGVTAILNIENILLELKQQLKQP